MKKEMTEQDALYKLTSLCATGEYCQQDMLKKMARWEIADDAQARIMAHLVKEKYIDEERFCRAYVKSKLLYNKWGHRKIEQSLFQKRIPAEISTAVLDDLCGEMSAEILRPLLESKVKTIKANTDFERNGKLIRFALSRGFDMDLIIKTIKEI